MKNTIEQNTDWTVFHDVKETLFPICYMPLKCLTGSETFIGQDGGKYIYWTSPDGILELIKIPDNKPPKILSNDVNKNVAKKNLFTYIPSFISLKDDEGNPNIIWDHEASLPETTSLFSDTHQVTSMENYMAKIVQYIPIAFNAYKEMGKDGIQIDILDISRAHIGETKVIQHIGTIEDIKKHLRNYVKDKNIEFTNEDEIIFTFSITEIENVKDFRIKTHLFKHFTENNILDCPGILDSDIASIKIHLRK